MNTEDYSNIIIKCFKDNNLGQLFDIMTNYKTKGCVCNYYDDDSQKTIFIDSSIEILSMFLKHTCTTDIYFSQETICTLLAEEKLDRIKLMFKYYSARCIISAICNDRKKLDWCLEHGYITRKMIDKIIYNCSLENNTTAIMVYAHEKGLIDHYDILLYNMLWTDDGSKEDDIRMKMILNNCSYVTHKNFSILLDWGDRYDKYVHILTDRKIFPKIDIYIKYFDILSKVMNCYEAYTLTELYTMLSPDKWGIVQQNKMVSIWSPKNKDILSSKRLMSFADIDVTAD